jgi:hypothetical protein
LDRFNGCLQAAAGADRLNHSFIICAFCDRNNATATAIPWDVGTRPVQTIAMKFYTGRRCCVRRHSGWVVRILTAPPFFPQPHASPAAVLGNELDARMFEGALNSPSDCLERSRQRLAPDEQPKHVSGEAPFSRNNTAKIRAMIRQALTPASRLSSAASNHGRSVAESLSCPESTGAECLVAL